MKGRGARRECAAATTIEKASRLEKGKRISADGTKGNHGQEKKKLSPEQIRSHRETGPPFMGTPETVERRAGGLGSLLRRHTLMKKGRTLGGNERKDGMGGNHLGVIAPRGKNSFFFQNAGNGRTLRY